MNIFNVIDCIGTYNKYLKISPIVSIPAQTKR